MIIRAQKRCRNIGKTIEHFKRTEKGQDNSKQTIYTPSPLRSWFSVLELNQDRSFQTEAFGTLWPKNRENPCRRLIIQ